MKRFGISLFACILLISILTLTRAHASTTSRPADKQPAYNAEKFSINLGDFQTPAELDYPRGSKRAPVVLLIHGAGPQDLEANVIGDSDGKFRSHIFSDIANSLTAHGFAVMRYNKHYITSANKISDLAKYSKLDMKQLLIDANKVLQYVKNDAHIDAKRMYLYGWSEGSMIASNMAISHPEIAGLILQGAISGSPKDTLLFQARQAFIPYVRPFASKGLLDRTALQKAWTGNGGFPAKEVLGYVTSDPASGDFTPNPAFDLNHDGKLDIDHELYPTFPAFIDKALLPSGLFHMYGTGHVLPSVSEQASKLKLPVLILQGRQDGNTPAYGAKRIDTIVDQNGNRDHTLHMYAHLGHSLGVTPGPAYDNMLPIAQQPLSDINDWLQKHNAR
ncbi:hypothetical protein EPA93_03240 [Ktedonosporobacter rubrisoli]|uniref:AB hydrolase-1 domain-containing protein n=1 Tax=Ktedonosporobacter rubrisoli TaxID=2509675 RepID=A0A4V0YY57_KTERU|nr:alpha/beta fold hydrolase [Ktedonosporobacter rubrisoli]QBD75061.1 hypothetical protein EPA93_03240 [Ktedonosporobacter rubrisoli]